MADRDATSHAQAAADFEERAEENLKAAATLAVDDVESTSLIADAQAAATLALAHRTAEQTELWSSLVRRTYSDGSLFLSVHRP